jgi:hypothetical protein
MWTDDAAETHQQPRKGPCWGVLRVVGEGGLITLITTGDKTKLR